jgi:TolB-like protein
MDAGPISAAHHAAHNLTRAEGFVLGPLSVDPPSRRISVGARSEMLEPRVMQVLVALGGSEGRVLSRDDLIEQCWDGIIVGDKAIDRAISLLRHALDDFTGGAVRLETITKVGFRLILKEPASEAAPAPAGNGMSIVAVLPFTHRGDDVGMEILAEDLTEEITRELVRDRFFKVIASGTMAAFRGKAVDYRMLRQELEARYLIEGKLQRIGEEVRLTMQLIDADMASMVWSPRFVRKAADITASPEVFPVQIASQLREHIFQIEANRALTKPVPYSGWEHILRVEAYMAQLGPDSIRSAIEEARRAISQAPDLGIAHAMLARMLGASANMRGEVIGDALIREMRSHITQAMQLDGDNPATLCWLGDAYIFLGEVDAGFRLTHRASELDPHSSHVQNALGFAYFYRGHTADSIAAYSNPSRLSPDDSIHRTGLANLGISLCLEGRPAEAEAALERALALIPDFPTALRWKAVVAAQQGREQAAIAAVRLLRKAEPDRSNDQFLARMRLPFDHPRQNEIVAILRGLLEETGDAS